MARPGRYGCRPGLAAFAPELNRLVGKALRLTLRRSRTVVPSRPDRRHSALTTRSRS